MSFFDKQDTDELGLKDHVKRLEREALLAPLVTCVLASVQLTLFGSELSKFEQLAYVAVLAVLSLIFSAVIGVRVELVRQELRRTSKAH
jgi:Mg/Co/Ni transporter MgtE